MYWTFNCFFRLLIYIPPLPQVTFKSWILTSEKKDKVARIEVRGEGGLGDSGNARKKTFFSCLMSSLRTHDMTQRSYSTLGSVVPFAIFDNWKARENERYRWKNLQTLLTRVCAIFLLLLRWRLVCEVVAWIHQSCYMDLIKLLRKFH